jgi:uncharacterized protein
MKPDEQSERGQSKGRAREVRSQDGRFSLFYRGGWAYLEIHPPLEDGRPVYPEDIENRMKILEVPRVGTRTLRNRIENATGFPEKLIEWPEGQRLASSIRVTVSEDAMAALVRVDPPRKGAAPPLESEILKELESAGVVSGVDRNAVRDIVAHKTYGEPVVVARGLRPVYGTRSRIQYHFNTVRGKPYLAMEFDRINLKELNFIENKKEGDLLAELLPPLEAVDGYTVRGENLPAETDQTTVRLVPGANTRLDANNTQLFATCDGNVRFDHNASVTVEPVVVVRNVNYETGHIRFQGSVVVEESVADGFVIEADGDIQVGKGVGKAQLKAGGNVLLKTGMTGNTDGQIVCGGNLFARYLESCSVECRGHLFVEEAIMQSRVTVWGYCVLNGRRSEILGGELIAGAGVWCKKLGNFNEISTRVTIGVLPDRLAAYQGAKQSLENRLEQIDETAEKLDRLEKALKDGHTGDRITKAQDQLSADISVLEKEVADLRKQISRTKERLHASRTSILVVEDTLYKGVSVVFGTLEFRAPDKGVRKTILRPGETGIRESGYDPRNRPVLVFDETSGTPHDDGGEE